MRTNRAIPFLIGIIVLLCLCIGAVGAWIWNFNQEQLARGPTATPPPPAQTAPPQPASPTAGEPAPDPEAADPGNVPVPGSLSPQTLADMDLIQQQVITIRGLQPAEDFTRTIFSQEDLRQRVIEDFFADYTPEEAADDALVLSIFGLITPDFDLIALYTELFSEQVAGFYDNETREMVVVGAESFGGPEKLTYAHEYNHALQDANYDLEDGLGYNDDACEADSERCAAIQALLEGDATLLELQWFFDYSSEQDRAQIFEYFGDLSSPVFDAAPPFLQQDFIFPYDQGYTFVETLFNEGGWSRVDAAYVDLPRSTEQILHPERYPSDVPVPVALPDLLPLLGDGWELLDDNVMGEWYTYLILGHGLDPAAQLSEEQAAAAAAGWGGDQYRVYVNREAGQRLMVLKYVWDSSTDEAEFAAAFQAYADLRFGPGSPAAPPASFLWQAAGEVHLFAQTPGGTIWIAAPDAPTADAVLNAVGGD